jgi:hypothetical protein
MTWSRRPYRGNSERAAIDYAFFSEEGSSKENNSLVRTPNARGKRLILRAEGLRKPPFNSTKVSHMDPRPICNLFLG